MSTQSDRYHVQLERIELTAPPPWIKADIRDEVFHDAGWHRQEVSILETDLAVRVAQAFEQHTWVSKVTRVEKRSQASLHVELEYRRPVAMVEVDYDGKGGLLPVDASGVLLPPQDFTAEAAITYPRITVDYTGPSGSIGTSWGDQRVVEAAKIAGLLIDHWQQTGLYRIVALDKGQSSSLNPTVYELRTRENRRVKWGNAPSSKNADETPAEQKVVKLLRYIQQNGKLDGHGEDQPLDLNGELSLSTRPSDSLR